MALHAVSFFDDPQLISAIALGKILLGLCCWICNPFSLGKDNSVGQSTGESGDVCYLWLGLLSSEFEQLTVESEGSVDYFLTLKPVGGVEV